MARFEIQLFLEDKNKSTGPYEYQKDKEIFENTQIILYDADELSDAIKEFQKILKIYGEQNE